MKKRKSEGRMMEKRNKNRIVIGKIIYTSFKYKIVHPLFPFLRELVPSLPREAQPARLNETLSFIQAGERLMKLVILY